MRACAPCLRRARLLGDLTPELDRPAAGRSPAILTLDDEALEAAVRGSGRGRSPALDRSEDELLSSAEQDERRLGVEAVCQHGEGYPDKLRGLTDPPAVLHVLGGVERLRGVLGPDLDRPAAAMVGARRAPADARRVARRFGEAIARAGITVVSGMAFGIDEAAHEGALAAGSPFASLAAATDRSGGTVAVLAGGPERATPARLRPLYERIVRDGVVVSELPPGATPRPWSFPARNRLIAALGDGLVVVAAAERSGSLTSARHAADLGRPVGVVPGSILDPAFAGSNALLRGDDEDRDRARALVVPDDVRLMLRADRLALGFLDAIPAVDPLSGLEGAARRIGERLLAGPRTIESLLAEDEPPAILAGLGALEEQGRLRRSLSGELELTTGRATPSGGD